MTCIIRRSRHRGDACADLHEVLEEHHRKEEGMLYPALDEVLTPEEGDALVSRIQIFTG